MSATAPLPPSASSMLVWSFPTLIDTRCQGLGLPADTLVHALGRRWLADGAGKFWPGGRGNGIFVRELLAGGPVRVESLPVIESGDEVTVLATHLLNAILARRGELTGEDYESLFPTATAYSPGGHPASVHHIVDTARGRGLERWLKLNLAELNANSATLNILVP